MNCPKCGGRSLVIDSRPRKAGVLRRRECASCAQRYSTVETIADDRAISSDLAKLLKRFKQVEEELYRLNERLEGRGVSDGDLDNG